MKSTITALTLVLMLLFTVSCGGMAQKNGSETSLEGVTNSKVLVKGVSTQDAVQAKGSNVRSESVGSVTSVNKTGIQPIWFIGGALLFGLIMPQPSFIRVFFV